MFPGWFYFISFGIALMLSFCSIPIIRKVALHYGWIDRPGNRKVHQQPIVRLGGISICLATLVALGIISLIGDFGHSSALQNSQMLWLIAGGFCFFLVGLADDLTSLSPYSRLIIQVAIASLIWWAGIRIEFITLPQFGLIHFDWLSLPLTILWITGVVNAINWIDGLDGLACGVSAIAGLITFIIALFMNQPIAALIIVTLIGSLLGFLYYNFNPAQIFMGDSGSYFIGFILAGVSIIGLTKSATAIAISLPLFVLAVPLLDMAAVIFTRLHQKQSPFQADNRHLHHRLLKAGLSHRLTVLTIYALTLWVGSWAIVLAGITNSIIFLSSTTGLLSFTTWKVWQSVRS